jgi:hypothetical protein
LKGWRGEQADRKSEISDQKLVRRNFSEGGSQIIWQGDLS